MTNDFGGGDDDVTLAVTATVTRHLYVDDSDDREIFMSKNKLIYFSIQDNGVSQTVPSGNKKIQGLFKDFQGL